MKSIHLIFKVHQSFRLRKYRFFDIGKTHDYYDDYQNKYALRRASEKSYLPMNAILAEAIAKYGDKCHFTFMITGSALTQMEWYMPEVLESFKELAKTGRVDFIAAPADYSLLSLEEPEQLKEQLQIHAKQIEKHFGQKPSIACNTDLIYSDDIGMSIYQAGYKYVITEGAKHVLGWKSPDYLYEHPQKNALKIILRNAVLSEDISKNLLHIDKVIRQVKACPEDAHFINLFLEYSVFGQIFEAESGIFENFKRLLDRIIEEPELCLSKLSDSVKKQKAVAPLYVAYPMSAMDEEKDTAAWLGNDLQQDAYHSLYALKKYMIGNKEAEIDKDWRFLQQAEHFYYMNTKWFSQATAPSYIRPYDSPYDAFINYMNVLADLAERLEANLEETAEKPLPKKTAKKPSSEKKKSS